MKKTNNFCSTKRKLIIECWLHSGKSGVEIGKIYNICSHSVARLANFVVNNNPKKAEFFSNSKYSLFEKTEEELLLGNNYKFNDVIKEL